MAKANFHIAVIPGDGIGKEVIPAALEIIAAVANKSGTFNLELEEFPWGCEYYLEKGKMMPEDGLEILKGFQAILFGAAGDPSVPDYISQWGLILPIRKNFNQYVNIRPSRLLPGISCPLKGKNPGEIDFVCVRENTEGEYSGVGGNVHIGTAQEIGIQTSVFTRFGIERTARYAFELAANRRRRLTSITKSNVMQYAMVFWDAVINEIAADYPDVEVEKLYIDAAAAALVSRPEHFDVIVGSNLFIDILSDLGPAIVGSLGMAASANINPEHLFPSMFEPAHGSAPDIAGQGIANPIGAIWSGALMLDHLGEQQAADQIITAIEKTLKAGIMTGDLGGKATTSEFTQAVVENI